MFSSQNSQVSSDANYIEDVFSTYLYTGTGANLTINNGIDLAGKGGLTWFKSRSGAYSNALLDTARGTNKALFSNSTAANSTFSYLTSFNSNGVTFPGGFSVNNNSGATYALWTFREQPKFFDVVTYTGNGVNSPQRNISHSLGSAPGCVIIKATSTTSDWGVWHRGSGGSNDLTGLSLNTTAAATQNPWGESASFNSSTFAPYLVKDASNNGFNTNGVTYVAYLFAHNAGGFGLTGTDNVISCGSFTVDGAGGASVSLGYEPQWLLTKRTNSTGNWIVTDTMRGWSYSNGLALRPNTSDAENDNWGTFNQPNATGFTIGAGALGAGDTYIYIAIRRGPMKVPTSGTSVFSPTTYTGNGATGQTITSVGFPLDFVFDFKRDTLDNKPTLSRLTANNALYTNLSDAQNPLSTTAFTFDVMNGFKLGNSGDTNSNGTTYIAECFLRAPSFFDEVCYTGTGSATTQTHNLGVAPEMIITKVRTGSSTSNWAVYHKALGATDAVFLDLTDATTAWIAFWNNTAPTASVFSLGGSSYTNNNGGTLVAYLFATCAGVSKVGSYTGTGTTQQINCGFTGGARFVLIKRTDATGAWYVWDSARGIVAGNDPYLLLNSTAAEVTNTDYIDTYSAGFEISSTAPAAINASGGTFIFLAIA